MATSRHTPEEDVRRIEYLLSQGDSVAQIAQKKRVSISTVKRIRKRWQEKRAAKEGSQ